MKHVLIHESERLDREQEDKKNSRRLRPRGNSESRKVLEVSR